MADHIQIGDVAPRIQYTGDGAQTVFTYPFPIFADADMEVYLDQAKQSAGFTVTGAGQSAGGDVTFDAAPASGVLVTLRRRLAIQRTSDFQESGEFRSKVINDELDYLTAALQQVSDDGGRALRLGATDPTGSLTLPDKETRADMFLGFDADGDPIASDASGPQGPTGPAGNMDGSNNLSELTDPETARSNLELGSAATKETGTNEGDLVELDAVGLPAVDASQLLNLAGDDTARANIVLNAFRIQVQHGLSVLDMVDGMVDEFEDETGVDTGASTNETYDATGDFYHNPATVGSRVTGGTPTTPLGTASGTAADINDDNPATEIGVQPGSLSAVSDIKDRIIAKIDLGSTQTITMLEMIGIKITAGSGLNLEFATSTDDTTYTQYGAQSPDLTGTNQDHSVTETVSARYIAVAAAQQNFGSQTVSLDDLNGYDAAPPPDMTLISEAATALSQPDEAFVVLHEEDVDAVTLNTDLMAWASRDGGTTWTQITLAEVAATFGAAGRILSGSADISGQPAGTSMKYKITTHNTKALNVHGVSLQWS